MAAMLAAFAGIAAIFHLARLAFIWNSSRRHAGAMKQDLVNVPLLVCVVTTTGVDKRPGTRVNEALQKTSANSSRKHSLARWRNWIASGAIDDGS